MVARPAIGSKYRPESQFPIVISAPSRKLLTETKVNLCASTQSFRAQTPTVLRRTL
ncbi:hypothetical protein AVDCRST_MAG84-6314 [uncultured Microcoleus sp.]|uniref:Uncharacterized protein n=1 Tax=uncultured Microcoleus sp. TaxID=259945 RepID=A0A6J4P4T1_9CYAN|nr:hypothetical protein AVDCRST_MAG84-6314 [uncultured Microcoleus sp.]